MTTRETHDPQGSAWSHVLWRVARPLRKPALRCPIFKYGSFTCRAPESHRAAHLAELAQLVARGTHNPKVAGSNPALGTFCFSRLRHDRAARSLSVPELRQHVCEPTVLHGGCGAIMELHKVARARATLRVISFGLEGHFEFVELVDEFGFFAGVGFEFFEVGEEASAGGEWERVDHVFEGAAFFGGLFAFVGVFAGDEVADDGFGEVVGDGEFEEAGAVEVGSFFGGEDGEEGDAPGVVGDAFGAWDADALPAAAHLVFEGECAADELDRAWVHGRFDASQGIKPATRVQRRLHGCR